MQIKSAGYRYLLAATTMVLVGCQQTPAMNPHKSSERAAYSEWDCAGNPMLAQFYGSRVVISDSSNSHWLDRGSQVGQVFSNEYYHVSFNDQQVEWQRPQDTVTCTPRRLPESWQKNSGNDVHFVAQGVTEQAGAHQWWFTLHGNNARIEVKESGATVQQRELPSGEADYYMDMWTYEMQTDNDRMRVQITDGLCRNQRDQIPYPSSVQINWNEQVFLGCGRWLAKGNYRP